MKMIRFPRFSRISSLGLCTVLLALGGGFQQAEAIAEEWSTPNFGGTGGTASYNLDCGPGGVMVGIIYKGGSWLDALGIICQKVNASTGQLGEEFTRSAVGGPGGDPKFARCPANDAVASFTAGFGSFVHTIRMMCWSWSAGSKSAPILGRTTGTLNAGGVCTWPTCNNSMWFPCPEGKVGKALRGRNGIYIDRVRFVCDAWDH